MTEEWGPWIEHDGQGCTPHWLPRPRQTFTLQQLAREAQSRSLYHRGKEVTLPTAPWEEEEGE